MRLVREN